MTATNSGDPTADGYDDFAQWPAGVEHDFGLLEALGVRVREVDDLAEEAVWLASHRLLIVDRALSPDQRGAVACRVLGRC